MRATADRLAARCLAVNGAAVAGRLAVLITAALAVGIAGCATSPPVAAQGLALKKVVIYRNGVGYFERGGHVDTDRVRFRIRKDEIGDFLATLAVLERGGSSVKSASFPLEVEEDEAPPPPKPPSPAPPPVPVGDSDDEAAAASAARDRARRLQTVVMSLDGKEHDLQVGYIAETPVWRPSYRLVIDSGGATLQAWGIVQNLSGEDWNQVSLSLVAEAPLAFDASLATPVIPPRPTVTDGGDVIAVVPRSETSLSNAPPPAPPPPPAPAAEAVAADEVDAEAAAGAMSSGPADMQKRRAAPAPRSRQAAPAGKAGVGGAFGNATPNGRRYISEPLSGQAAYSRQTRNLSALAAIALQAGATRYQLPTPVTIPDRSATMVMLLDRRVPGQAIALYAPDGGVPESSSHPFRVARFTNQTGGLLERGPLAIFSEGAFLGQGMADPLPDGATATVPFALERTLAVQVTHESREEGARLYHIEGGTLMVVRDAVWLTKYHVKNGADRASKLMVKHPRVTGARLEKPPAGTEDNVGTGSALVPLAVGPRATLDLPLDERLERPRQIDWLSALADDAVKAYLADRRADATIAAQLKAAWDIRQDLVKATEQHQKLSAETEERRRATEETRANLKALEKNAAARDLRAKLASRLAADAGRLDVLGKQLVELGLKVNENQIRFNEAIRSIKLLQPLPASG